MASDDDSYVYQLIEFIVRGLRTTKKLDIVPCSWVSLNKKTGKIVTKFMPPPYHEERSVYLQTLVETLSDPSDDWSEYNVIIRGGARSYKEAEARLRSLKTKEYAFTNESDVTQEEKAAEAVRKIKQNKLKLSAERQAAMHRVSGLNSDSEIDLEQKSASNGGSRPRKKTKHSTQFSKLKGTYPEKGHANRLSTLAGADNNNKPSSSKVHKPNDKTQLPTRELFMFENSDESDELSLNEVDKSEIKTKLSIDSVYTDSEGEKICKVRKNNDYKLKIGNLQCLKKLDSQSSHHKKSKEKVKPKCDKTTFSKSNQRLQEKKLHRSKTGKITSDSELLWEIYHDLQKLKVDIEDIKANQSLEKEARHKAQIEEGSQDNFIIKYNLDLPFNTKLEFDQFCETLATDQEFRKEFMKSLNKLFDRANVPSCTIAIIKKKYLSSEMAVQFTAIKRMPNKFLMKETIFYDCLLGVLSDTHRDQNGKFITESIFATLLGNVLGNAKDWKRNRKRSRIAANDGSVNSDGNGGFRS